MLLVLGTFVLVGAVAFGAIQAARTIHKSLLDNNLKVQLKLSKDNGSIANSVFSPQNDKQRIHSVGRIIQKPLKKDRMDLSFG